jgi:hypothetical protein
MFIFVPAFLPLIFGGDWVGALWTLAGQVVFISIVFAVTSCGLITISIWAIGRLFKTLGQTVQLFTRSSPLLLIGFISLFINAKAWQSAG